MRQSMERPRRESIDALGQVTAALREVPGRLAEVVGQQHRAVPHRHNANPISVDAIDDAVVLEDDLTEVLVAELGNLPSETWEERYAVDSLADSDQTT